jgi:hypothetical protein
MRPKAPAATRRKKWRTRTGVERTDTLLDWLIPSRCHRGAQRWCTRNSGCSAMHTPSDRSHRGRRLKDRIVQVERGPPFEKRPGADPREAHVVGPDLPRKARPRLYDRTAKSTTAVNNYVVQCHILLSQERWLPCGTLIPQFHCHRLIHSYATSTGGTQGYVSVGWTEIVGVRVTATHASQSCGRKGYGKPSKARGEAASQWVFHVPDMNRK